MADASAITANAGAAAATKSTADQAKLTADTSAQSTMTKTDIGWVAENLVVIKWYQYWLHAKPKQRRAAQPALDSLQDLPNLWRQEFSHNDMPGSPMVLIARIAEAAKHNDATPMRFWLWERGAGPMPRGINQTGG